MSAKNIIPKEMQVKTLRNSARNVEVFARAQIPTGGLSSVAPFCELQSSQEQANSIMAS